MMIDSKNPVFRECKTIEPLVRGLSEIPGVLAILLGGSWSTGHGDKLGDIDIGILNDSGRLDERCLPIVRALARPGDDSVKPNPYEVIFWDGDDWTLHVRCANESAWREALAVSRTDPAATEPNQLEMLQTCHFLVPLFDPKGTAEGFRHQAESRPYRFWQVQAEKNLQSCLELVARFRQCEELPPLAYALSVPCPLAPVFRTLSALNRCFYFYGSRAEDYIGTFSVKPERVLERLARIHRLTQDSEGSAERRTDEYESLVHDISGLFRKTFGAGDLGQQTVLADASEDLYTVPSWIEPGKELLWHASFAAGMVSDWPGPLSKYVERGAYCHFQGFLGDIVGRVFCIILRLNAIDSIPLQRLDETFSSLPVQPQDAYSRLLDILYCPDPRDALAPSEALARETEAIVKAQEP